ncbi:hypothetical protein LIA77_06693 [Sarocladium implicatum]|nr:hypothetical protein LIA77_06693 [Sarocladium implicatum]
MAKASTRSRVMGRFAPWMDSHQANSRHSSTAMSSQGTLVDQLQAANSYDSSHARGRMTRIGRVVDVIALHIGTTFTARPCNRPATSSGMGATLLGAAFGSVTGRSLSYLAAAAKGARPEPYCSCIEFRSSVIIWAEDLRGTRQSESRPRVSVNVES